MITDKNNCIPDYRYFWHQARESKTVLDSGFHAVDSGFQLLDSRTLSVELGFRIPISSGIPDSQSCIPGLKAQRKIARIPNSTSKNSPNSGIEISLRHLSVIVLCTIQSLLSRHLDLDLQLCATTGFLSNYNIISPQTTAAGTLQQMQEHFRLQTTRQIILTTRSVLQLLTSIQTRSLSLSFTGKDGTHLLVGTCWTRWPFLTD